MTNYLPHINNQRGALMVFALLIVTTLTIAGIMVANMATMEGRAAHNVSIRQQCLYAAMAAAQEMAQEMESLGSASAIGSEPWFYDNCYDDDLDISQVATQWGTYNRYTSAGLNGTPASNYMPAPEALVVWDDHDPTGTGQDFYAYTIIGRAQHGFSNRSQAIVMLGYRIKQGNV